MAALHTAVFFAIVAGSWYLIPFGLRQVSSAQLRRRCRAEKSIVLSYDDGPSVHLLPRLLDLLADHGAQATFFLLGRNIETRKDAVPRLLDEGHELGGHSFAHLNAWKSWPGSADRDLALGQAVLRAQGVPDRLFRPPYGKVTLATLLACRRRGLRLGWWTIDSRDAWGRRPIKDVIEDLAVQGGGVVLMHDRDTVKGPDGTSHQEYVLRLTQSILEFAEKNRFRIRRLGDLYGDGPGP